MAWLLGLRDSRKGQRGGVSTGGSEKPKRDVRLADRMNFERAKPRELPKVLLVYDAERQRWRAL